MKPSGSGAAGSGQAYANELRHRRPRHSDTWHLDEVFLAINGRRHYLWRAVDQDDNVLDILVKSRRNKKAAKKFFKKLLKGLQGVPRVIITDQLKSYAAAKGEEIQGTASAVSIGVPSRNEPSIRELGGDHGHGTGCLRGREDRGNVPACLDGISFN